MGTPREVSLQGALDELYGEDPAEFVATRKRLAGDLRAAGEVAAAKTLQAARRPTTAAWALNQLARREPAAVETFLDRSRELRAAQTRALSGRPDVLRDAMHAQRDALMDAASRALAVLGARGNESFRSEILSTLQAASVDEETGEELRTGRLAREAVPSTGFPDSAGLSLVTTPDEPASTASKPAQRRARTRGDGKPDEHDSTEAERARQRAARAELDRVNAALRKARHEAETATKSVARSQKLVGRLENELDAARERLREAQDRTGTANEEVARLTDELEQLKGPGRGT